MVHTDIGEIGNWTIREQAVSQKRIMHLTSGIDGNIGGICHRVPTVNEEWITDFEISIKQDTFLFIFSKYVCPDFTQHFQGINISFTPIDEKELNVQIKGDQIFGKSQSTMRYQPYPAKTHIKITKTSQYIKIDTGNTVIPILQFNFSFPMLQYGYFSVFAISPTPCNNCITNLHSFLFFNISNSIPLSEPNISLINRKYLSSTSERRTVLKMQRRAKMLTISDYLDESIGNNDILNGNESNVVFNNSMKEIHEMTIRATSSMSAQRLTHYIDTQLMPVLEKASKRFENIATALWQMKSEMNVLWDKTKKELRAMNLNIKMESNEIKKEAENDFKLIKDILDGISKEPNINMKKMMRSRIEHILAMICFAEFLCFGYFLARDLKRHKEHKLY